MKFNHVFFPKGASLKQLVVAFPDKKLSFLVMDDEPIILQIRRNELKQLQAPFVCLEADKDNSEFKIKYEVLSQADVTETRQMIAR